MTHLAEGPATKSGALGVGLARASIATLEHYAVILWAVTALTTVYLIVLPPGADVITGLAWADLEALQGHFPISLSDLWLSRGIGYKAFLYLAEGLSRFVAGDALRIRIAIFNAIFIALAVGVLSGASWAFLLRRDPGVVSRLSLRDRAETLALAALCFVPAVIWSWAQDTHISVLLCVLGIGLVLSPSARAQWCSGIVLFLLFSIKGVTALDFLFVLATAFATGDAARIRRVIVSAGIATAATGLAYATVLRGEFENILLAAQFQENNLSVRLGAFLDNGLQFAAYNPAIPIALLVACGSRRRWIDEKKPSTRRLRHSDLAGAARQPPRAARVLRLPLPGFRPLCVAEPVGALSGPGRTVAGLLQDPLGAAAGESTCRSGVLRRCCRDQRVAADDQEIDLFEKRHRTQARLLD